MLRLEILLSRLQGLVPSDLLFLLCLAPVSFDLLYLGGATQLSLLKNISPSLALTMNTGCTHAYIVPATAMKYILSIIRHSVVEVDKFYIQQIQQRGKSFYVTPPFANPGNSFSDIVQKDVHYKKALSILNS